MQIDKEHLKDRATQLLNDDVLNMALSEARQEFLEQLVDVEPLNMEAICSLQGTVQAIDTLKLVLERYIIQGDS